MHVTTDTSKISVRFCQNSFVNWATIANKTTTEKWKNLRFIIVEHSNEPTSHTQKRFRYHMPQSFETLKTQRPPCRWQVHVYVIHSTFVRYDFVVAVVNACLARTVVVCVGSALAVVQHYGCHVQTREWATKKNKDSQDELQGEEHTCNLACKTLIRKSGSNPSDEQKISSMQMLVNTALNTNLRHFYNEIPLVFGHDPGEYLSFLVTVVQSGLCRCCRGLAVATVLGTGTHVAGRTWLA